MTTAPQRLAQRPHPDAGDLHLSIKLWPQPIRRAESAGIGGGCEWSRYVIACGSAEWPWLAAW
jgi:hypothetical protein